MNGSFFPAAVFNAAFDASGLMEIDHGANHTLLEWKKGQFEQMKALIKQAKFDDSARRNAQALYETKLEEFSQRNCPSWDEEVEVEEAVLENLKQDTKEEEKEEKEEDKNEEENEENSDSDASESSSSSSEAPVESSNNTSPASSPVSKPAVLAIFETKTETTEPAFEELSEVTYTPQLSDDELFESLEELYSEFKKSYAASQEVPPSHEAQVSYENASFAKISPTCPGSLPLGHGWLYNNDIFTIPEEDEPEEISQTEMTTSLFTWTVVPGSALPRCEPRQTRYPIQESFVQKICPGNSEVRELPQPETLQANSNQDCSPSPIIFQKPNASCPSPSKADPRAPANLAYCLEDFPFFRHVLAQTPRRSFLPGDFFKFRELCYPKEAATFLPGECFRLWSLRTTKRGPRRLRRRARAKVA